MNRETLHPDALELADILREQWGKFQHAPGTIVNESAAAGDGDGGDGGESDGDDGGGEQPVPLTREDIGSEFDQRFEQLRGELMPLANGGGEQDEGEGEGEDYGALAERLMQEAAETGELTPENLQQIVDARAQAQVQQAMETLLPQAVQQAVQPLQDRFLQQDADQLEKKYPALSEPETQNEVIQEAVAFATTALGDPELARSPQVIETVYLAKMAREGKTPAVPAGGSDAALEGAGGAQAGADGGDDDADVVDGIVNAGGRGGDLFSGAF
jgi:hypothetical protein